MAGLRDLLREQVEQSRRDAGASRPRDGVFTPLEDQRLIHFVTTGRRTGEPRKKFWLPFAPDGDVLYLLEEQGTRADWVRNILADPKVEVEGVACRARLVDDTVEIARARTLCAKRFSRVGLVVADLIERGLVVALQPV